MYGHDTALIATPIGMVRVTGTDDVIHAIAIEPEIRAERAGHMLEVRKAADQLRGYFAGQRIRFNLHLASAATLRGQALRDAMMAVPYGETETYGVLARRIASSARAMGQACATNPFPIVVPCHRVTSAQGPENYSAGDGPATKRWLIDHEHAHRSPA